MSIIPIPLFDEEDESEAPDPIDVKLGLAIARNTRISSKTTAPAGPGQREHDLQRIADIERRRSDQERLLSAVTRIKIERFSR